IFREEAINYLFSISDCIVYVFSAFTNDVGFHEEWFKFHVQIAKTLNKLCTDIPWIFVLHKVDAGTIIPPALSLPPGIEHQIIKTSVVPPSIGIDTLWKRILEVTLDKQY
ncbi:MAG: hypothetical protein AB1489_41385, partial [Acidobacteriota bacterium]